MTCQVIYKPDAATPAVTLTFPAERLDELILRASERFCGPWRAEDEIRWRALLKADENRRKGKS